MAPANTYNSKYIVFLKNNFIAFSAIFIASITMKYLSGFDIEVGSYLYLPIGAKILVFLLFGRCVFPGVVAACIICGFLLFGQGVDFIVVAFAGAISPLFSIWVLDKFQVMRLSDLDGINFRHILFLILFTSIVHSISKFLIYAKGDMFSSDPTDFLAHYLLGDILGGLVVILFTLKVVPYFFMNNKVA